MTQGRDNHPVFARMYARLGPAMDKGGMAEHRAHLLSGLNGAVVEIGCGNGLNFAHYPAAVTRVLAVEPDPYLRRRAIAAASAAPVPIEVVDAVAERIPTPDASFDAAVACLVLCSVPDQGAVLGELRRVLRPGGTLRFLEHVRATTPGMVRFQRVADRTVWPLVAGGCHVSRDTEAAIGHAGFTRMDVTRFDFPESRVRHPAAPHVLGTATRE
jgi:ubiquinone/menaquinone biosynthesis C-methylase UbiE